MGRAENPVQAACLQYLQLLGAHVWRNNTGFIMQEYKGRRRPVRFGESGSPDILGVLNGRAIGVECKKPLGPRGGTRGSVQSDEQKSFQAEFERAGGLYILARSVDDVEKAIGAAK